AMADGLLAQSRQPGIEALGFEERLALLVDVQHTAAYNAALRQRLKAATLRQTACLEDLDLRTPRGLDRTLVATLASGQWIRTSQSVLLTGPTGVGKTFIACALGHQAARDGFPVLYRRLPRLLDDLAIARVAGRHRSAFTKLARTRLLIIDEWMMTRLTADQRRDLMEVIDDRHDRAATILVSQIPVSGWFDQIGDATYADALLDRIVHNAHRIELRGESMRRRTTVSSETDTATAT
ncbi:hypothetical protein N826_38510, partial [Skermanella aerolata KACC 11604]